MNPFVEQFRDLSTEYLLERRAHGEEGLVADAHRAIELILTERGVPIPPMPTRSIYISADDSGPRRSYVARNTVLVAGALLAAGVAKALAVTWLGLLFSAAVAIALLVDWFRRRSLPETERQAEELVRQAERDGLTKLMQSAASGDLLRVRELVTYGTNVNARSGIGSTALMYAARNNHIQVAEFLLGAGADLTVRTQKGSTAAELAAKAGHAEMSALLTSHVSARE